MCYLFGVQIILYFYKKFLLYSGKNILPSTRSTAYWALTICGWSEGNSGQYDLLSGDREHRSRLFGDLQARETVWNCDTVMHGVRTFLCVVGINLEYLILSSYYEYISFSSWSPRTCIPPILVKTSYPLQCCGYASCSEFTQAVVDIYKQVLECTILAGRCRHEETGTRTNQGEHPMSISS